MEVVVQVVVQGIVQVHVILVVLAVVVLHAADIVIMHVVMDVTLHAKIHVVIAAKHIVRMDVQVVKDNVVTLVKGVAHLAVKRNVAKVVFWAVRNHAEIHAL